MTAGHGPVAGDAGEARAPGAARAETYLRVMAETELRRALVYPRYVWPEPSARAPVRARGRVPGRPVSRLRRVARPLVPLARRPARGGRSPARWAANAAPPLSLAEVGLSTT
jgi:hypothetical protein